MADPNTLKVLAIDGGGERGYFANQFLKQFVNQWGIHPSTLAQQFDVICGTSVGGIMALSLADGLTPDELDPFFTTQGPYIFSLTSLFAGWRPSLVYKLILIAASTPFYQSSGPTADFYGSGLLKNTIQTQFGSKTLQNLNTNVIIPSFNYTTGTYVLFSNVNIGGLIGQNFLVSDCALATGAAPVYLPAWNIGGDNYIDGGVYQNNASSFGIALGKTVKKNANRICILSIGTGRGELGFDPTGHDGPPPSPLIQNTFKEKKRNLFHYSGIDGEQFRSTPIYEHLCQTHPNFEQKVKIAEELARISTFAFDTVQAIFALFEIAATGGQESIAEAIRIESTNTLDQIYSYRFQTQFDSEQNTELDNTDTSILNYYDTTESVLYDNDSIKISSFLGHLTA
jgi:predicted acylesterase/phospholipase RssA